MGSRLRRRKRGRGRKWRRGGVRDWRRGKRGGEAVAQVKWRRDERGEKRNSVQRGKVRIGNRESW